jgi:ribosome-associated translation inhibitor RaiA
VDERNFAMPDGHLQRIDERKNEAIVVRNGRRFVAAIGQVDTAARVPGARVHFDIDHSDGIDAASNVRLASGTRTNKRQRRFGDLTGAKLPGAKVKSTSTTRLGVDVTTQPKRVVAAWLEAMTESRFDDATSLYSPSASIHTSSATVAGRKAVRATLEDDVSSTFRGSAENVLSGSDQLVRLWVDDQVQATTEWFEVHRGAIVEHWHGIEPDVLEDEDDGPAITIIRSGDLTQSDELRLREDLLRVAARVHGPVEEIRVKVDTPLTPSHPFSVSAALHAGGTHVRSHVTAPTFIEAIDSVSLRLRTQVERIADRNRRPPDQHRPDGESWRHGDRPSPHELTSAGPIASSREIVRHKSWGPSTSSIDEALWDMEQADYDFFLFTEAQSGTVGLVWHDEDGLRAQLLDGGLSEAPSGYATMELRPAPTMTVEDAQRALNELNAPFVFAKSPAKDPFVLYRRYDGDYGLIEPIPVS